MTMHRLGLFIAVIAVAVLAGRPTPSAEAEADGSIAIGCEFLGSPIDGDPNDVVFSATS